jgi:hypothetical protein
LSTSWPDWRARSASRALISASTVMVVVGILTTQALHPHARTKGTDAPTPVQKHPEPIRLGKRPSRA